MKHLIFSLVTLTILTACSNGPAYQKMSCSDLRSQEKALIKNIKVQTVEAVLDGVVDIAADTDASAVSSIASDITLSNSKDRLKLVQSTIKSKRCPK